jgi:dihydroneopterin aldolase
MEGIVLESMELDAIIGITDAEQRAPQRLRIDIALGLDVEAASKGDMSRSVDYAALQQQILTLVQYGQFRLLESLAIGLARLLLAPPGPPERRAQVDKVDVLIRKPTILQDAVPGVRVVRDAAWCELDTKLVPPKSWVDTLVVTDQGGAWRLHVEAQSMWEIPPWAAVQLIAGEASADGRPLRALERLARGQHRRIVATSGASATLLVVGPGRIGG